MIIYTLPNCTNTEIEKKYSELNFINDWHFSPFYFEKEFSSSKNILECDTIGLLLSNKQEQQIIEISKLPNIKNVLVLDLYHIFEHVNVTDDMKIKINNLGKNFHYIHTNLEGKEGIYYDFLWNRQKGAFEDFDKYKLNDTVSIGNTTQKMFELNEIKKSENPRKFLSPNRIYTDILNDRIYKRIALQYILQNENGYVNDPERGNIFESQEKMFCEGVGFEGFSPIHNKYYESSFVSIYVETLTYLGENHMKSITEKTWNPLIKGHFILPYGYNGLIEDIKSYGFKLPDWLDYSYDNIENNIERFDMYIISIRKFLEYSIEDLKHLFIRDKHILEYNRNLFFEKPFDKLYDKIISNETFS